MFSVAATLSATHVDEERKKAAAVAIDMVGRLPNLAAYESSDEYTVTEAIKAEATLVFAALYGKRGHDCSLNTLR